MKKLLVMLLFLCSAVANAQDVIVKKDGSTIVCRVISLSDSEIVYKKWTDLNGANYVMERSAASAINYQNGKREFLSETTNLYKPNNQNDGVQQYNDRALLNMDYYSHDHMKKVKILKAIGWAGGVGLVAAGAIWTSLASGGDGNTASTIGGLSMCGGGVLWTVGFLIAANQTKKNIDKRLLSSAVYQYDLRFENGSSLLAGIDMLSDIASKNNCFGIGLRYNF